MSLNANSNGTASDHPAVENGRPEPLDTEGGPASSRPYPLLVLPLRQTKQIHFIRHGQGYHNVAGHLDYANYKSEEW